MNAELHPEPVDSLANQLHGNPSAQRHHRWGGRPAILPGAPPPVADAPRMKRHGSNLMVVACAVQVLLWPVVGPAQIMAPTGSTVWVSYMSIIENEPTARFTIEDWGGKGGTLLCGGRFGQGRFGLRIRERKTAVCSPGGGEDRGSSADLENRRYGAAVFQYEPGQSLGGL